MGTFPPPGPSAQAAESFRVTVQPASRQLSRPSWMQRSGVNTVVLGFATGYMLTATQNADIWHQNRWRFQVLGPLTVANPHEARLLNQSFTGHVLSGLGVVELQETAVQWLVHMTWAGPKGGVDRVTFPIKTSNTGLVYAMYGWLHSQYFPDPTSFRCQAVLSLKQQGIHDAIHCSLLHRSPASA
jgi:hypothetical protein